MSVYTEVEVHCDGEPGSQPFACNEAIVAKTGQMARREAREAGWLVSAKGGKDYCPQHRGTATGSRLTGGG